MTTGDRIKELRLSKNLSQGELAIKMGYKNRVSIHSMENNRHKPSYRVAQRLAIALDTTAEYILFGDTSSAEYYATFENIEKEVTTYDKLKDALSSDAAASKFDYSDEQLEEILNYARYIGSK